MNSKKNFLYYRDEYQNNSNAHAIFFQESIDENNNLYGRLKDIKDFQKIVIVEPSQLNQNERNKNLEGFRKGNSKNIVYAHSFIEDFDIPPANTGIIICETI